MLDEPTLRLADIIRQARTSWRPPQLEQQFNDVAANSAMVNPIIRQATTPGTLWASDPETLIDSQALALIVVTAAIFAATYQVSDNRDAIIDADHAQIVRRTLGQLRSEFRLRFPGVALPDFEPACRAALEPIRLAAQQQSQRAIQQLALAMIDRWLLKLGIVRVALPARCRASTASGRCSTRSSQALMPKRLNHRFGVTPTWAGENFTIFSRPAAYSWVNADARPR
jgi:hypothetical protein